MEVNQDVRKILIVGSDSKFGMENSYKLAFEQLGYKVEILDFDKLIYSFIPIRFLKKIGLHVDIKPPLNRANHALGKKVFLEKPYAIIAFTHVRIFPGALEYLKKYCNNVFFYWPDSIVNMTNNVFSNLKHYHNIFSHSLDNIEIFKSYNLDATWLPFAGDTCLSKKFDSAIKPKVQYDFSFIGGHRKERFEAINQLAKAFPNSKFLIVGLGWKKINFANNNNFKILDKMVDLNEFLSLTAQSKVSLNPIDHLNYPSSNLRFFEVGLSSVPQLCTFVPEFDNRFVDKEHVFYYRNLEELVEKAKNIFNNYSFATNSAQNFRILINSKDNYVARVREIEKKFI